MTAIAGGGAFNFAPFGPVKPMADSGRDWRGSLVNIETSRLSAWRLWVGRDQNALTRSIESFGLSRPLWVAMGAGGGLVVISGGRRLAALKSLGAAEAPCLCPNAPSLAVLAIADNLERGLNPAEMALAWSLARSLESGKEREAIREVLGFSSTDKRLHHLEAAESLPDEGLEALAAGRLDLENAGALLAMPSDWAAPALRLVLAAKASRQNRRRWLEWLGDLARIKDSSPEKTVSPELLNAAAGPDGERLVADRLASMRFPGVHKLLSKRRALLKSLSLPDGLRLELDPELEDVSGELKLSFDSLESLKRLAQAALELAGRDELARAWRDDQRWPPS